MDYQKTVVVEYTLTEHYIYESDFNDKGLKGIKVKLTLDYARTEQEEEEIWF